MRMQVIVVTGRPSASCSHARSHVLFSSRARSRSQHRLPPSLSVVGARKALLVPLFRSSAHGRLSSFLFLSFNRRRTEGCLTRLGNARVFELGFGSILSASLIYQHFKILELNFGMSKKKKSRRTVVTSKEAQEQEIVDVYEGQRLNALLDKIWRSIELAKLAKGELSDNIWIKQQFAIGVNDVTRLLERMPQGETTGDAYEISCSSDKVIRRATLVPLQVVLVAADCNPKWLTKHVPTLASSRKVPVIIVRDGRGGSLRMGGLLKLKTALAIGVKVRGSAINATFEEII